MSRWERILKLAARVKRVPEDRDLATMLAAEVEDFDAAMRTGTAKLPARWEPAAPHLAGYEYETNPFGPKGWKPAHPYPCLCVECRTA